MIPSTGDRSPGATALTSHCSAFCSCFSVDRICAQNLKMNRSTVSTFISAGRTHACSDYHRISFASNDHLPMMLQDLGSPCPPVQRTGEGGHAFETTAAAVPCWHDSFAASTMMTERRPFFHRSSSFVQGTCKRAYLYITHPPISHAPLDELRIPGLSSQIPVGLDIIAEIWHKMRCAHLDTVGKPGWWWARWQAT